MMEKILLELLLGCFLLLSVDVFIVSGLLLLVFLAPVCSTEPQTKSPPSENKQDPKKFKAFLSDSPDF